MKPTLHACLLVVFFCAFTFNYSTISAQCTNRYLDTTVFTSVDSTFNVVYTTTAGGNTTELMDVYEPAGDTACLRHLIIWVHGGAFFEGSKNDGEEEFLSTKFAQRGYVCASINYRLASSIIDLYDSAQIFKYIMYTYSDIKAAIRYFYQDALQNNQWGIDTNVIFIGGSSAGAIGVDFVGTLDSLSQLSPPFQTIAESNGGIDGNSGNAGFPTKVVGVASLAGAINSLSWITPTVPPMILCQGTADNLVPYDCGEVFEDTLMAILHTYIPTMVLCGSGEMAPALDSAGVSYSFLPFPGAGHVPWDTNQVMEDEVDSAVAAFFYSVNCVQSAGPCYAAGIAPIDGGPQINIYPNPAGQQLYVMQDAAGGAEITLFDDTGRKIMEQSTTGKQTTLSLQGLAAGIYLLQLDFISNNASPVTRKVVVE